MKAAQTVAIAGAALLAVPAVGSAAMAYLSTGGRGAANYPLVVANDDGSGGRTVARATAAEISPDGTRIAFQVDRGSRPTATRVMHLATGATASVTGGCLPWTLAWSPDSRLLACMTESVRGDDVTGNGLAIATVPSVLSGVTSIPVVAQVTARGNSVGSRASFSPDSLSVAYSNQRYGSSGLPGLYVAPVGNPAGARLLISRAQSPVWGTGGIAFSRLRNVTVRMKGAPPSRMTRTELWIADPAVGGLARQLTHWGGGARWFEVGPTATAWVPGGAAIVGQVMGQDYAQAIAVSTTTGRITNLSRRPEGSGVAAVSRDGGEVLLQIGWESPTMQLQVTGITGQGARTVVRRGTGPSVTADWNPA